MITIQLVGIIFALTAIYVSYLHYKRKTFSRREYFFWLAVWIAFMGVTMFPKIVRPLVGYLHLQRPMDLIMILAFILIFALTFQNYTRNRRQENRIEELVRDLALKPLNLDRE